MKETTLTESMIYYEGKRFLNKAINNLSFKLHIPTYNFCEPASKLQKRLQRGDKAKSPLVESCLKHDLFYNRARNTHVTT